MENLLITTNTYILRTNQHKSTSTSASNKPIKSHSPRKYLPVVDVPPGVAVDASPVELPVLPAPAVRLGAADDRLAVTRALVVNPAKQGRKARERTKVHKQTVIDVTDVSGVCTG